MSTKLSKPYSEIRFRELEQKNIKEYIEVNGRLPPSKEEWIAMVEDITPEWDSIKPVMSGFSETGEILEARVLSTEQASKLVKKAGDNGNGNGTSLKKDFTKRYQNLVESIERRKLSQAIDNTKVYFMNPKDKQIYRIL